MPNYVSHRIVMTGDEGVLAHIRERHFAPIKNDKGEDYDFCFDFDTIIPMPQELKNIPRDGIGRIDEYLGELATMKPYPTHDYRHGVRIDRKEQMYSLDEMKRDFARMYAPAADAVSYADLLAIMGDAPPYRCQHQPRVEMKYTDLSALIGTAIKACGYGDTLEFCTKEWGTKWGSFRCGFDVTGDGTMEFHFETAWSPPRPIFRKFAAMYPHVCFHGMAFDEGWNFEAHIVGFNGFAATESAKATKEGYRYVYGKDYVEDDEEAA